MTSIDKINRIAQLGVLLYITKRTAELLKYKIFHQAERYSVNNWSNWFDIKGAIHKLRTTIAPCSFARQLLCQSKENASKFYVENPPIHQKSFTSLIATDLLAIQNNINQRANHLIV